MRCIITGHTSGVGKALYDHFAHLGWDVQGMSSSNGYNIPRDIVRIARESAGCDLFINNSYANGNQIKLLNILKRSVKKIVVCGSISRFDPYPELLKSEYTENKSELANMCRLISISNDSSLADILHLDLSFIEGSESDPEDPEDFVSDYTISYDEIISSIDFWLDNPKVRQIEFVWKLTPFLKTCLERIDSESTTLSKLIDTVNTI